MSEENPGQGHAEQRGLLLAVDTAGADAGLVLAGDGFVDVLRLPLTAGGQARTEDLSACAASLLSARGLEARQLTALAAVTGPGSYTGLRSGLAFVRGLALPAGLPTVAVGSLELLAWRGAGEGETVATWWPAGAGRSMTARHRREGDDVVEVEPPRVVEDGDGIAFAAAAALVMASAPGGELSAVTSAAKCAGLEVRVPEGDSLAALAVLALGRTSRGEGEAAAGVLPLYVGQSTARPNRHRVAVSDAPE